MTLNLSPSLLAIKHRGEFEYPKQVWYLILSALALATVINVLSIAWTKLAPRFFPHDKPVRRGVVSAGRVPAALLTAWRVLAFRCHFPSGGLAYASLFEVFVICIYMAALLIWEFVHTNNLDPNFWSNRAGHIAAAQLSLLPALSSKNNIIGLLTGLSYERLNLLHRAAGRCIYVLIWVHFWGRWRIGLTGLDDLSTHTWQQLGAVAGVAYTLIIVLSFRPIRRWSYEIFYVTHIVMVLVFIITAVIHVANPGFASYIWPVFIVWGVDKVISAVRYLVLNVVLAPRSPTPSSASLTLITPDTFAVTLTRRMPLGWVPGQHAFLIFPRMSAFAVESHPFTIATIPQRAHPHRKDYEQEQELVFLVRARDGMTARLLQVAANKPGTSVPVQVNAPYGAPTDLAPYRTCVLFAGGTGISYTLPLLLDIVRRASKCETRVKRIRFVWIMRSEAYLSWATPYLHKAVASCPSDVELVLSLFVTGPESLSSNATEKPVNSSSSPSPSTSDRETQGSLQLQDDLAEKGDVSLNHVKGRPDVRAIIEEETANGQGPIAVEVSGPARLVDTVRFSLSRFDRISNVMKGGPVVNFHAEAFEYQR